MDLNTLTILTTAIVVVIGIFLAFAFHARQRTRQLQDAFGPEYKRAIQKAGSRRKAEASLKSRQERLASLQIRPLRSEEQDHFLKQWRSIQAEFVDNPKGTVDKSNRLVTEMMLTRGYPMANFDQRIEDLSVDHPEIVSKYREAHSIAVKNNQYNASTEELRQAVLNYKAVFDQLMETQGSAESEPEEVMVR
jgi:hypothetical protein